MKLIYCKKCQDVYSLHFEKRTCRCGQTWGLYGPDGLSASYGGITAVPLGFSNISLITAIAFQPEEGMGQRFDSFVIPKKCATMLFEDEE